MFRAAFEARECECELLRETDPKDGVKESDDGRRRIVIDDDGTGSEISLARGVRGLDSQT
jgi:hypothetical protein